MVPDHMAPIVAYRRWQWDANVGRLRSIFLFHYWPIGERCEGYNAFGDYIGRRPPPCVNSLYGIYAFKSLRQSRRYHLNALGRSFIGEVYLWGQIVEHEIGYRAEFAYPKRIIGGGKQGQLAAQTYGISHISRPRYLWEGLCHELRRTPAYHYRRALKAARTLGAALTRTNRTRAGA